MTETTLSEVFDVVFDAKLSNINTQIPAEIVKYDYKNAKADVQPLIKKKYLDGTVESLPVCTNVPVVFPRSSESGIMFPLNKGDGCLLEFSQRNIDNYLNGDGEAEPADRRKFDMSDGIAIVGLWSFKKKTFAENNKDFFIQHKDQTIVLKEDGSIVIGKSSGNVTIGNPSDPQLSGVLTGSTIDTFTGMKFSLLPGSSPEGKNISSKVKVEF